MDVRFRGSLQVVYKSNKIECDMGERIACHTLFYCFCVRKVCAFPCIMVEGQDAFPTKTRMNKCILGPQPFT